MHFTKLIITFLFLAISVSSLKTSAINELTLPNANNPKKEIQTQTKPTNTNIQFSKLTDPTSTNTQSESKQETQTNLKLTKLTSGSTNTNTQLDSKPTNGKNFTLQIIARYTPSNVIATFEPFVEAPIGVKPSPEQPQPSEDYSINQILNSTLPSGAIAKYPTTSNITNKINPYFSNLAVCGLATEAAYGNSAKKQEILDKGWASLDWYKSRQNPTTGFVSDYSVINGVETSLNNMDSVDSYVATYFLALQCMHKATGDTTKLKTYSSSMKVAFDSLESVKNTTDNLYIAKPDYDVKFLMDNTELSRGLLEASKLFALVGDNQYSTKSSTDQSKLDNDIETYFWDSNNLEYRWAIAGQPPFKVVYQNDYTKCYADSQANIWRNTFSTTISSERKNQLALRFDQNSKDIIDSGKAKCKWNPIVATGMINAGQTTIANDYNNYGLSVAKSGILGGIYTAGHDGMFLVNKYKLLGQTLFF
jgi:hypothetical protein